VSVGVSADSDERSGPPVGWSNLGFGRAMERARRSHSEKFPPVPNPQISSYWSAATAFVLVSCSGDVGPPSGSIAGPSADEIEPPIGVADRGDDPAIVALYDGERAICSGALVASDVVITSHRCVAKWAPVFPCHDAASRPAAAFLPGSLRVLFADAGAPAQERARGSSVSAPVGADACSADIALVILDTPIDDVAPLPIRAVGAAKGDRLRTVGFESLDPSSPLAEIVRDHLPVVDATSMELKIGESCERGWGAAAIEESTGEIVGVASRRAGPSCFGSMAFDVYTRTDAFLSFIGETLARVSASGVTRGRKKTRKGPIDLGANCSRAADCAAGVCVTQKLEEYCSRSCGAHDHCPSHFNCQKSSGGASVCVKR
jgi:hypothetical protein